jgi:hypothetical protein
VAKTKTALKVRLDEKQAQKVAYWMEETGLNASAIVRGLIDSTVTLPTLRYPGAAEDFAQAQQQWNARAGTKAGRPRKVPGPGS